MPTVTAYPTSNTVVASGWVNPTNAYASEVTPAYATAAPAKSSSITTDYGGFGFASSIPAGSVINSITIEVRAKASATGVTGQAVGWQAVEAALIGAETTTPGTTADATYSSNPSITLAQLQSAQFRIRMRATKGNTNTAVTFSLDYVRVTVDYSAADVTPPISSFVSQTATKVSRVTGKNQIQITFHGNEEWQQYQVRRVSSASDSVTAGTQIQFGPNDQSFETAGTPGGIGWTTGGSGGLPTIAFSTTWASKGTRSIQLSSNGSIANAANNYRQALSPKVAIAPGQSIAAMADLNITQAAGPMCQMSIAFFDANNTFLSQSVVNVGNSIGVRQDQKVPSVVAPANAASFCVIVTMNGAPTSGATTAGAMTVYIDNVRLLWPGNQDFTATVNESDFETAGATEGDNLLKVFVQDTAGNWSA